MSKYKERCLYITRELRYLCPVPLKLNTYRGCEYDCQYCSVPEITKTWNDRESIIPLDLDYLEKYLRETAEGIDKTYLHQLLKMKLPIQIGVLSDPFQPCESEYRNTYDAMELLMRYNQPYILVTKGTMFTEPEYLEILKNSQAMIQLTLITLDQDLSSRLEPNAPTVQERLDAIKILHDNNIPCQIRYWPIIPGVNDDPTELFKKVSEYGASDIVAGFAHVYTFKRYLNKLNKALGYDYKQRLRRRGIRMEVSAKYLMPLYSWKRSKMMKFADLAEQYGMGFYSPNVPSVNNYQPCCGSTRLTENQGSWALKCHSPEIAGSTFEEYMVGKTCPFEHIFKAKWESGVLEKWFTDLTYDEKRKLYKLKDIQQLLVEMD